MGPTLELGIKMLPYHWTFLSLALSYNAPSLLPWCFEHRQLSFQRVVFVRKGENPFPRNEGHIFFLGAKLGCFGCVPKNLS